MKFNKYFFLIIILALTCCCIGLCSAANPLTNTHTNDSSSNIFGMVTVHLYEHYNKTTHKFEHPIEDVYCDFYKWNDRCTADSQMTNSKRYCVLYTNELCGRYHLEVTHESYSIHIKYDVKWYQDDIFVSPEYCMGK